MSGWERHAAWWQQGFTEGADPEYAEQLMPIAEQWLSGFDRVLDLGCGEGQIARQCIRAGSGFVAGVDSSRNQIAEAVRRGGGPRYLSADAADLPFAHRVFDAAVACLVFEHLDRLDDAIGEVARVVRPGGRFVLFLNHPLIQTPGSGWIDDQILDPPEQYWRIGPYLDEDRRVEEVDHGVRLVFHHRPMSRYVNALAETGLHVERMLEPSPPPGFVAQAPEYDGIRSIPRLLVLITRRD